jgi:hypothetical protein
VTLGFTVLALFKFGFSGMQLYNKKKPWLVGMTIFEGLSRPNFAW